MHYRKILAIDLDDVLAEHAEAFIDFSNKNYGTHLTISDYSDNWNNIWNGVSSEEIERRATEFHKHTLDNAYSVKRDAIDNIKKLSKNNDIHVITARPMDLMKASVKWVEVNFEGIFKDVHFVPVWNKDNTITKADVCNQIGASYLIDDLASNCNIAAKSGIKGILFGNYSWNRNERIDKDVIRCKDWNEIVELINHTR